MGERRSTLEKKSYISIICLFIGTIVFAPLSFAQGNDLIDVIGHYNAGSVSMCSQNCEYFSIGFYPLTKSFGREYQSLTSVRKTVWASGKKVEVKELPTIAGPFSRGKNSAQKIKKDKFQVDEYQEIKFPKITISETELSDYLENRDSTIYLEFENPTDKILNFKVQIDDNEFQYIALLPKERKKVDYIYKSEKGYNDRREDNSWYLVVVNDFFDEKHVNKGYFDYDESYIKQFKERAEEMKTVIYVEQFGTLEDLK